MKISIVPCTIEQARAARERAGELVRSSRTLIQNSNALLDKAAPPSLKPHCSDGSSAAY